MTENHSPDLIFETVFLPVAAIMIAHGYGVSDGLEALKRALLTAALDQDGAASDSRVSAVTGLHRKDVRRLRATTSGRQEDIAQRRTGNAAARVLTLWANDPDFHDAEGAPRALPRHADDSGPGIEELVQRSKADMSAGTLISALVDSGSVETEGPDRYRLLRQSLVPASGTPAHLAAFEATVSSHLKTAAQNLLASEDGQRQLDRAIRYSHLSDASLARLQDLTRERATALLEEINALANALQIADESTDATGRFAFGAYAHTERKIKE